MRKKLILVLIALPAFVATWSGWVGLGKLTGFGKMKPLPGIADWTIDTAITLPIGVEIYAAYAMHEWLSSMPGRLKSYARASTIFSLAMGIGAQIAYHICVSLGMHHAPLWVVSIVASLPVVVLGMAAGLYHLSTLEPQNDLVPQDVDLVPPQDQSVTAKITDGTAFDTDDETVTEKIIAVTNPCHPMIFDGTDPASVSVHTRHLGTPVTPSDLVFDRKDHLGRDLVSLLAQRGNSLASQRSIWSDLVPTGGTVVDLVSHDDLPWHRFGTTSDDLVPRQDHHATEQDQIVTARRLRDLEGLGVPAIATALGVSKRTVYRLLEDKS
jgi:hypothetical protein